MLALVGCVVFLIPNCWVPNRTSRLLVDASLGPRALFRKRQLSCAFIDTLELLRHFLNESTARHVHHHPVVLRRDPLRLESLLVNLGG